MLDRKEKKTDLIRLRIEPSLKRQYVRIVGNCSDDLAQYIKKVVDKDTKRQTPFIRE